MNEVNKFRVCFSSLARTAVNRAEGEILPAYRFLREIAGVRDLS